MILSLPPGSGATLTQTITSTGWDQDKPGTTFGKAEIPQVKGAGGGLLPVNDVHVSTRLVKNGKVVKKST